VDRLEELWERFKNEPLVKLLDARLPYLGNGKARVFASVRDEWLIVNGIVQGGVITAIADFAGVYAAMTLLPSGHAPCANINIDFLRPVTKNDLIEATANVLYDRPRSIIVEVRVRNYEGVVGGDCAYATMRFAKPRTEPKP
jgi:acyl-CoA thioesterase